MNTGALAEPAPPVDAALAAALFAVDPVGLGGIAVRARAGPLRDLWLEQLRACLPAAAPMRRVPLHAGDNRILGGLDLAATLRAGRPIVERGLLAEADGGILILAMAERITAAAVARLSTMLDAQEVVLERDGLAARFPARVGVVALDEGIDDERPQAALLDRLAFRVDFDGLATLEQAVDRDTIRAGRALLGTVAADDEILGVLSQTALALGVVSLRAEIFALRTAKASAALAGRTQVEDIDAARAARLVLAPRATRLPTLDQGQQANPQEAPSDAGESDASRSRTEGRDDMASAPGNTLGETVLEAARVAIPPGLLMLLRDPAQRNARSTADGQVGAQQLSAKRGRPAGFRRGEPRGGARLNLIETLRAAAPWQKLRARTADRLSPTTMARIDVRPDDFRVTRFNQRSETTTIFVVDASGSLALNRLAEAKGAVELLLAECYTRRDHVALLAFRGTGAELLLPPTRSLVRAKRSLASLPGGGATPLATAIDSALLLGEQLRRRGQTPVIVLLTDGSANVTRDGATARDRAEADALQAARAARASGIRTLVVDAAQRPQAPARRLAQEMAALYVPLPHADAAALSKAVRASAL